MTELIRAIQGGDLDAITTTIDNDALTFVDEDGRTALHHVLCSTKSFSFPIFEHLLRALNNLDERILRRQLLYDRDNSGWTALHMAASRNLTAVMSTIITMAEMNAGLEESELRLKQVIDAANGTGRTPLHYAASKGHAEASSLLLRHGADANVQDTLGQTPLHRAASAGHASVVSVLLQPNVAATDIVDGQKQTALDLAVADGNLDCAKLLSQ